MATAAAESEGDTAITEETPIAEIVGRGESSTVEFKSSLRMNLHTKNPDPKIEHGVLKTLAAFLNTRGGTLVIGVDDKGAVLGVGVDGFPSEDKMDQHLANLIRDRLGAPHVLFIHPRFADYEGKRVLVVTCDPGKAPAYVKDGKTDVLLYSHERNYVGTTRQSNSRLHQAAIWKIGLRLDETLLPPDRAMPAANGY